jgi:hypothetical protein
MNKLCPLSSFLIVVLAGPLAWAQPPRGKAAAVTPYKPVAVTLTAAPGDPKFAAFRQELAEAARSRVYAKLAALVETKNFFWDRDFANRFDRRRPAVDNLAIALRLEHHDGLGWRLLADFAADTSATPNDSRPGVYCSPGQPAFDPVELDKLIDVTRTDSIDWAYPRVLDTPVRVAPASNAAVVETVAHHFVRLLGFEGTGADNPIVTDWAKVATPSGKTGFVAPNALLSPAAEQLCYAKNTTGAWQIVGYVARGD